MAKNQMKERMEKMWGKTRKDLDRAITDADKIMKKGEKYFSDISGKGKDNLDILVLTLQREKLYYELGKEVAQLSEGEAVDVKKEHELLNSIKSLSLQIDKLKKK